MQNVVSYWNSTSNHNNSSEFVALSQLYLIEILHQTTTERQPFSTPWRCILLKFYIKPQPSPLSKPNACSCILLKFYIKPQQRMRHRLGHSVVSYWNSTSNHNLEEKYQNIRLVVSYWNSTSNHNLSLPCLFRRIVVSYWNSTSNHNYFSGLTACPALYLIEILHQTTTTAGEAAHFSMLYLIEILHQTTTIRVSYLKDEELYLIEILHQTTTSPIFWATRSPLYLIEILHQTTTCAAARLAFSGCILLKFYIKPQPVDA